MTNKPTSTTALEPTEIAATQTIIRADNGDVIVADETGLRMRLSDRVIEDISTRLGKLGHSFGPMHRHGDPQNFLGDGDTSSQVEELSYVIDENIDCWAVQQRREFASFMANLPGLQGVRGFLKHLKGGGIIADTAGPIQMILAHHHIGPCDIFCSSRQSNDVFFHPMSRNIRASLGQNSTFVLVKYG